LAGHRSIFLCPSLPARHPVNPERPGRVRSCKQGRHAPPVHMIKLTETREITPYVWVHPDQER
jgi:hypothetical protein